MIMEERDIENSNDHKTLVTRCSPSRVHDVLINLNEEKKELVKEMGLGSLLGMKKCKLRKDLILWLLKRFDPIEGSIKLALGKIKLNSQNFGETLGIIDGGEDIGTIIMEDSNKKVGGDRLSISCLQQTLEENKEGKLFVRNIVLYIASTLLIPSSSIYVSRSLEETITESMDTRSVRSKNWASISWRYLVEGIRRFQQQQSQSVCGCIYFLQLYYFSILEGHDRYVDKCLIPSNWWSETETKEIVKWIVKCGGFEKVKVKLNTYDTYNVVGQSENHTRQIAQIWDEVEKIRYQLQIVQSDIKDHITTEVGKVSEQIMENIRCLLSGASKRKAREEPKPFCCARESPETYPVKVGLEKFCTKFEEEYPKQIEDNSLMDVSHGLHTASTLRHMYTEYVSSGCKVVGPFRLESTIDFQQFNVAMHIFDSKSSLSEVLFRHKEHSMPRFYFCGLLPQAKIDIKLLAAYVLIIRYEESIKFQLSRKCCVVCMPIRKKDDNIIDLNLLSQHEDSIPISRSAKVIIPILDLDEGHWYMVEFNKIDHVCCLWDSLGIRRHNTAQSEIFNVLAQTLDQTVAGEIISYPSDIDSFVNFKIIDVESKVRQDNNYDCGIFVMKYIQFAIAIENKRDKSCIPQFNPIEVRLNIGLQIVQSTMNEVAIDVQNGAKNKINALLMSTSGVEFSDTKSNSRVGTPKSLPSHPLLRTKKQRTSFWMRFRKKPTSVGRSPVV